MSKENERPSTPTEHTESDRICRSHISAWTEIVQCQRDCSDHRVILQGDNSMVQTPFHNKWYCQTKQFASRLITTKSVICLITQWVRGMAFWFGSLNSSIRLGYSRIRLLHSVCHCHAVPNVAAISSAFWENISRTGQNKLESWTLCSQHFYRFSQFHKEIRHFRDWIWTENRCSLNHNCRSENWSGNPPVWQHQNADSRLLITEW